MHTMNVVLPPAMLEFVQNQVSAGRYRSASEYLQELIQADQKQRAREVLEAEVLKGLRSGRATPVTADDWKQLRQAARRRSARHSSSPKRK